MRGEKDVQIGCSSLIRKYAIIQPVRKLRRKYTKEIRMMKSARAMSHISSKTEVLVSKRIMLNVGYV